MGRAARGARPDAPPRRRHDEGRDARDGARARPRPRRREAGEPGDLLRPERRLRRRTGAAARPRRARAVTGADRAVRWRGGRNARRVRALHHWPAARTAWRIRRADVRGRHPARDARGRHRPPGGAARSRRRGPRDELARRVRPARGRPCGRAGRHRAPIVAAGNVRVEDDEIEVWHSMKPRGRDRAGPVDRAIRRGSGTRRRIYRSCARIAVAASRPCGSAQRGVKRGRYTVPPIDMVASCERSSPCRHPGSL